VTEDDDGWVPAFHEVLDSALDGSWSLHLAAGGRVESLVEAPTFFVRMGWATARRAGTASGDAAPGLDPREPRHLLLVAASSVRIGHLVGAATAAGWGGRSAGAARPDAPPPPAAPGPIRRRSRLLLVGAAVLAVAATAAGVLTYRALGSGPDTPREAAEAFVSAHQRYEWRAAWELLCNSEQLEQGPRRPLHPHPGGGGPPWSGPSRTA
jgi:hypothetical protein